MDPADLAASIPTFDQLMRIAPAALLVLAIAGAGFATGWWSRGESVRTLREWLETLLRKPPEG